LAALVCAACQSDGSSSPSSGHERQGSESSGEASGDTPTSASDPSKPGSSKPPTAGSDAPSKPDPAKDDPAKDDPSKPETKAPEPLTGDTEFSSADPTTTSGNGSVQTRGGVATAGAGGSGATAPPGAMSPNAAGDASSAGPARTVERGDIYRVLDDHRILNLNAYRGLQVIDVSNVDAPRIEGRLAATGTPLELYVVGQRAIVLINDWQGYYGSRDDVQVEKVAGGLVLNVDISNRAAPKLLSQAVVKGSITTSRLTQGGGQAALYVAANVYQDIPPYSNTTLVKSFDVSGDAIAEKSEIDLGGYVQDVQATAADLLLVSSIDYNKAQQQSQVSVIDISRADGTMMRGGSVTVRGIVENKFNMDAYNGVLRVVSGSSWSGTRENHLETFSLTQLSAPRSIAHCAFAPGDSLFATIFIENKGFFVTYLRQDPFHAFSIDDQGRCEEHNEFIVSGWNDFLRPTLGGTRLVGVGSNDTQGRRTISISLYDTTNIDNPRPLLARADLALDNSYSEAQWDDRAFSVIEDAVNVRSSNGTLETGLILVPFQGYVQSEQRYVSQVQILTFSAGTLTRRGVMDHGTAVRRSFLADATTAANLSEEELRLYNIGDPNKPVAKGRVEVAPNYRQVFVYGDYVARVHDPSMYFGWYGHANVTPPAAKVEIVPRSGDLETSTPVASFDVPSNATLVQANKLLLTIVSVFDETTANANDVSGQRWNTHIDAFDLSDPAKPAKRGSLDTDRIRPSYGYYPYPGGPIATRGVAIDCFDCFPYPGRGTSTQYVVGDAVVFVSTESAQKSVGTVRRCYEYANSLPCTDVPTTPGKQPTQTCPYVTGGISCAQYEGQAEECSGGFYECPGDGTECKELDPKDLGTQRNCYTGEEFRYWNVFGFDPLDVRDPDHLVLGGRVQMDKTDEGTSVYTDGKSLYFNFQRPLQATNDPRAMVKRYFKEIGFADPQHGSAGKSINVPGDVIAADGTTIYTRDWVWEEQDARTLVARLIVDNDRAYLQGSRVFNMRSVSAVKLDGAGHMLVSSEPSYSRYVPVVSGAAMQPQHKLSILDAKTLDVSGETDVDTWATFQDALNGRALFSVSGGLLVVNVSDPAKPAAQAYFPTLAWPSQIYFDGHEALFAGGPYGVYRFNTDLFNLLMH
jgi:hypothetical protein